MSELRIKNRSESDLRRFFLGFLCNCLSYFTTAKITFTSIRVRVILGGSFRVRLSSGVRVGTRLDPRSFRGGGLYTVDNDIESIEQTKLLS